MGRIELNGSDQLQLETLVTYVKMQRAARLFAIRTPDALVIRPKVVSKTIDTVYVSNVTGKVFESILGLLDGLPVPILQAEAYSFSDDRGIPGSTE